MPEFENRSQEEQKWRRGMPRALDTSAEAEALQLEILRRMDGASRLRLAMDMSLAARALALAGLRDRHPEYSESDLTKALLRMAFPADALPPPLR
jgi:hypothetical protein